MSPLLELLVKEAQSRQLAVTKEAWWDHFVVLYEQIKQINEISKINTLLQDCNSSNSVKQFRAIDEMLTLKA